MLRDDPSILDAPVTVLAAEGWHAGIVGIVASRFAERLGHPTIVLGTEGGRARGSARSIAGFNLHGALEQCQDLLTTFGGHRMAAGLTLPGPVDPRRFQVLELEAGALNGLRGLRGLIGRAAPAGGAERSVGARA